MKLKTKTTRQLSMAVGIMSFVAFVVMGLGDTWGFSATAKQITNTIFLVSGGVNVYFLGVTHNKNTTEAKNETSK
jgi:hypothetical protein